MAVSMQQWEQVAASLELGVRELFEWAEQLDRNAVHTDVTRYRDREGDPLGLGQWAVLFESRYYRVVALDDLPPTRRVLTVWHGVVDAEDDNSLFSSAVLVHREGRRLRGAGAVLQEQHWMTEAQAIAGHDQLYATYRDQS